MADDLTLKLPCPIGGTLWRVCILPTTASYHGHIYVKPVVLNKNNFWRIVVEKEFGKTVFLTKDEAHAAAAELREGGDNEDSCGV